MPDPSHFHRGIIREAVASGSDLGQEANLYHKNLIPDELAMKIVYERLSRPVLAMGSWMDFPHSASSGLLDERLSRMGQVFKWRSIFALHRSHSTC